MPSPISADADVSFEPTLSMVFFPRCPSCHAPHPRARKPAIDADECPDCGAPSSTGFTEEVPAVIVGGGLQVKIGMAFINLGNWLRKRAREI